jgi:hypothetical protein
MAFLYGRSGRLTAQNGGFRPTQGRWPCVPWTHPTAADCTPPAGAGFGVAHAEGSANADSSCAACPAGRSDGDGNAATPCVAGRESFRRSHDLPFDRGPHSEWHSSVPYLLESHRPLSPRCVPCEAGKFSAGGGPCADHADADAASAGCTHACAAGRKRSGAQGAHLSLEPPGPLPGRLLQAHSAWSACVPSLLATPRLRGPLGHRWVVWTAGSDTVDSACALRVRPRAPDPSLLRRVRGAFGVSGSAIQEHFCRLAPFKIKILAPINWTMFREIELKTLAPIHSNSIQFNSTQFHSIHSL